MELFHQFPAKAQEVPGLRAEQAAVPDLFLQLFLSQGPQFFRCIEFREKPGRHFVYPFIGALSRKDHGHQQFKR